MGTGRCPARLTSSPPISRAGAGSGNGMVTVIVQYPPDAHRRHLSTLQSPAAHHPVQTSAIRAVTMRVPASMLAELAERILTSPTSRQTVR